MWPGLRVLAGCYVLSLQAGSLWAQGASQPQKPVAPASAASVVAEAFAAATGGVGAPDLAKGKRAFQRYCAVCHGLRGEGGLGPALQGIAKRLSPEDINRQLMNPRGSMPRLYPNPVDDKLLIDLRAYLLQMQ